MAATVCHLDLITSWVGPCSSAPNIVLVLHLCALMRSCLLAKYTVSTGHISLVCRIPAHASDGCILRLGTCCLQTGPKMNQIKSSTMTTSRKFSSSQKASANRSKGPAWATTPLETSFIRQNALSMWVMQFRIPSFDCQMYIFASRKPRGVADSCRDDHQYGCTWLCCSEIQAADCEGQPELASHNSSLMQIGRSLNHHSLYNTSSGQTSSKMQRCSCEVLRFLSQWSCKWLHQQHDFTTPLTARW